MNFTIDTRQLDQLREQYRQIGRQSFDKGLAIALTRIAQQIKAAQQREISDVFDRPTRYTLGQVYLRYATVARLEAEVGISDYPYTVGYLKWHIVGGQRRAKAFERLLMRAGAMPEGMRAVPGRFAQLDAFGNFTGAKVRQILSQLRIEPTQGATSALPRATSADRRLVANARRGSGFVGPLNRSAVLDARARVKRISAAYGRAGGQFVAFPNGRGKLRPGIYLMPATAGARRNPKPVLIFVTKAEYEAGTFDFGYVSRLAFERTASRQVNLAMAEQLQRFQQKYGTAG